MNYYLNIYLQIGILFGIICFCVSLIKTFRYRFKQHKWYLDYINKKENSFGYYIGQSRDCEFWLKDYLPEVIEIPFNIALWPIAIIINM